MNKNIFEKKNDKWELKMNDIKNEQEEFWAGEFGDEYIDRNKSEKLLAANLKMFAQIFSNIQEINSIAEYGCNIGMNLQLLDNYFRIANYVVLKLMSRLLNHFRTISRTWMYPKIYFR